MRTLILISALIFVGNSIAQKSDSWGYKDVVSQLDTTADVNFALASISMNVWPNKTFGVKPKEDESVYTFTIQNASKRESLSSVPYSFIQIYNNKKELIGASMQGYGSFYDESGIDMFQAALASDTNFEEVEIYLVSGFGTAATTYSVSISD